MARKKGFFQKYRLVFHSSPLWLKFGLLVTVLMAIVTLSVIGGRFAVIKTQYEQWRLYAAQLEQVNAQYKDKIENLGTVDSVTDIAGEELGMVDKDATLVPVRPQESPLDPASNTADDLLLYVAVPVAVFCLLILLAAVLILRAKAKGLWQNADSKEEPPSEPIPFHKPEA